MQESAQRAHRTIVPERCLLHFWQWLLQIHLRLFPLNFAPHYEDKKGQIEFAHNYLSHAILN